MSGPARPEIEQPESILFSSFRVDRRSGELTRAGTPIPLRPKTWSVLLYLAERPGALVTRDELLDAVWPDVAVTPDTLTKSIGELRLALGDDAARPRFIATVHRRGFRFLPVPADAPVVERPGPDWQELTPGARPFVGRAAEIQRLDASFLKASRGERQIVFVTGPPGVGKTTVIEALLDLPAFHRATPPVWIARAACVEQHGPREPYMPVLDALGRLARRPDASGLAALLRRTAPTWLAQMPWLIGDDAAALRESLQAARAERMLREFAAFTQALTADVTLVLVLEDLHWCDPATVDLLALLGEHSEPARLLVIGSYRPAELVVREHVLAQAVRTMLLRRQCSELPLHDFAPGEVQRYLKARLPGASPPPSLTDRLYRHTDGNPLFVASVVEHMLSRGWILDTAPGWSFAGCIDRIDLGMPDDVRRMIATQFESLPPADRDLLGAASVCGYQFATHPIAAALRRQIDDVDEHCERLARTQRFICFAGSGEWPDGSPVLRYRFIHELYRQAMYEARSPANRQRLHQRIGEELESRYGDRCNEFAAELAVHFDRAGDAARTLRYLVVAGARARQRFAGREAIDYLEAAIAVAARLPDELERQRQELALRVALAPLLNDHFGFASAALLANCERADQLCQAVGTPEQRFEIVYALGHVYASRADLARCDAVEAEMDGLAQRLGTDEHRLLSDSAALRNAASHGMFAKACALADGRLAPVLAVGLSPQPPRYGADPVIGMVGHHAFALWYLGEVERARSLARANIAAAERPGVSKFTQAAALALTAIVAMLDRDTGAVRRLTGQLLALAREQAFPFWGAIGLALHGWARMRDGELDGLQELERARTELASTGACLFSTYVLAFVAEAQLRRGDLAAGLAAVDEGLRVASTTYDRSYWSELWRLQGELLQAGALTGRPRRGRGAVPADDNWSAAEHSFEQALERARASQAKSLELRAATSLARAWLARGRAADARRLLEPLCGWFGAATGADLDEARALLAELARAGSSGDSAALKTRLGAGARA
jgi:DNA-binding winged helix-turn-helix (wHTH) protein